MLNGYHQLSQVTLNIYVPEVDENGREELRRD